MAPFLSVADAEFREEFRCRCGLKCNDTGCVTQSEWKPLVEALCKLSNLQKLHLIPNPDRGCTLLMNVLHALWKLTGLRARSEQGTAVR